MNKKILSRFFVLTPAFFWALLIFLISSIPAQEITTASQILEIFYHFSAFFILALLINNSLKSKYWQIPSSKRFCLVLFLSLVYAFTDELHQSFVPQRTPSFEDWLIDSLGITSYLLLS